MSKSFVEEFHFYNGMKIGALVQLKDYAGIPLKGYLGTVIGFNDDGRIRVHWHTGDLGKRGYASGYKTCPRGRLKVLA
jgi:hypothetical protein